MYARCSYFAKMYVIAGEVEKMFEEVLTVCLFVYKFCVVRRQRLHIKHKLDCFRLFIISIYIYTRIFTHFGIRVGLYWVLPVFFFLIS